MSPPFAIVGGGGFAHSVVEKIVVICDVCAELEPVGEDVFKIDLDGRIHQAAVLEAVDLVEISEIPLRAKRIAEALTDRRRYGKTFNTGFKSMGER